ncbi:hypothetical protein ACOSQ4_022530 [Xanthoceras sorbifolium]
MKIATIVAMKDRVGFDPGQGHDNPSFIRAQEITDRDPSRAVQGTRNGSKSPVTKSSPLKVIDDNSSDMELGDGGKRRG